MWTLLHSTAVCRIFPVQPKMLHRVSHQKMRRMLAALVYRNLPIFGIVQYPDTALTGGYDVL
jgi:hypothetical protein